MTAIRKLIPKHIDLPDVTERRRLRLAFGISQNVMAAEIGIAVRTLRNWENVDTIKITVRNVAAINKYGEVLKRLSDEWAKRASGQ